MLVLSIDSCLVPVATLICVHTGDSVRAACMKRKKRNWRFKSIFQSIHSLSCSMEYLKFILNYQVTDALKKIEMMQFTACGTVH